MPNPVYQEDVTLPSATPGQPDSSIGVGMDLTRETIVGGAYPWYAGRVRALPDWTHDRHRISPETFDDMMLDTHVFASINIRRLMALAQDWAIISPEKYEGVARAELIRADVENQFRRLRTPFPNVLFELLSSLIYGWAICEQVYEMDTTSGWLNLVDLVSKDVRDVVIFTTAFGKEIGYRPARRGVVSIPWGAIYNYNSDSNTVRPQDGSGKEEELYDRRKIVIHKHMPTAWRQLGTSALRAAYGEYWFKQVLEPEHLKFVTHFGSPTIKAHTAENAEAKKPVNQLVGRPDPGAQVVYPERQLGEKVAKLHNSTWIVLKFGEDVDYLEVKSDGKAILEAYDLKDRGIVQSILFETLATQEGERQARAASETHKDVLDLVVTWDKADLENSVDRDCIYWYVFYNYGQADADMYAPHLSLGRVEHQDIVGMMEAVAQLANTPYIHRSQFAGIDKLLHMPARDTAMEAADYEKDQKAKELKLQQPVMPVGGTPSGEPKGKPGISNVEPKAKPAPGDKSGS